MPLSLNLILDADCHPLSHRRLCPRRCTAHTTTSLSESISLSFRLAAKPNPLLADRRKAHSQLSWQRYSGDDCEAGDQDRRLIRGCNRCERGAAGGCNANGQCCRRLHHRGILAGLVDLCNRQESLCPNAPLLCCPTWQWWQFVS